MVAKEKSDSFEIGGELNTLVLTSGWWGPPGKECSGLKLLREALS